MMLCASTSRLRIRIRNENTENGIRTERMTPSDSVKVRQESFTKVARNAHNTCDSARNGR